MTVTSCSWIPALLERREVSANIPAPGEWLQSSNANPYAQSNANPYQHSNANPRQHSEPNPHQQSNANPDQQWSLG
jgi:hypothetical protein